MQVYLICEKQVYTIYFKMKIFIREDSCQLRTQTEAKPLTASCYFFYLLLTKGIVLPSTAVHKISDIWWLYAVL